MDANKQAELRRFGFKIRKTCGICTHGRFPYNDWGTCAIKTYDHLKHSTAKRHLSITVSGSCAGSDADDFELNEAKAGALGHYREFLEK